MQMAKHKKRCLHSLCKWQNVKNSACIAYANAQKRFQDLLTVEQTPKNKAFQLMGYRLKAATIFCGNPRQSTALFSVGDRR